MAENNRNSGRTGGGNRGGRPGQGGPRQGGPGRGGKPGAGKSGGPGFKGGKPGGKGSAGRPNAGKPGTQNAKGGKPGAKGPAGKGTGPKGAGPKGAGPKKGQPATSGPRPYASTDRYGRKMPDKVAIYGPHRRRRPKNPPVDRLEVHDAEGVRLQKLLANAGVASRRVCEEMITESRVTVDGDVVTELGVRVDPKTAEITVDGLPIQLDDKLVYYAFNKPEGVVCTMDDQEGRQCISDFLIPHRHQQRVFHVGRLDIETEGLLLLTNDGELTNRLTHPSYEVPKTYLVQVRGPMEKGIGDQMKEGLMLEDGIAKVDSFRLVDSVPGHILVEVVLHSGRNRIVRRLFDAVGHPVERLVRTQVGPIRIGDQKQGVVRDLSKTEVGHLLASVGLSS
ncbi:rRNA pseudouridine synthase [Kocuria coralli]|uniref:Pseudouridine synthase n=1 Tax=Kocuria coralli TaxID=1461025 RepID=A0A5J5KUH0_9MICC|nr:pseudouridine synthase [Kocuria coralli]KAA9393038.1 rRNA pseudouridine synthase [Kocuria coralli]